MAKIENAKGRNISTGPSGYERLFGNHMLGQLISKCQAAVISSGNELERRVEAEIVDTEGIAIGKINEENRIFKKIKTGADEKQHGISIDVVIDRNGKIKLIELKDGDVFDVKKIAGEVESLNLVRDYLIKTRKIKPSNVTIHFCSFNQEDTAQIYRGAKNLIPMGSAMTGRELCRDLGIDFGKIVIARRSEQPDNFDYFVEELVKIPEFKRKVKNLLK